MNKNIKHLGKKAIENIRSDLLADPTNTLKEFQDKNSINVKMGMTSLKFLNYLGLSRCDGAIKCLDSLKGRLMALIAASNSKDLIELLNYTMNYIYIDELRSIPLAILAKMNPIPQKYLEKLYHIVISNKYHINLPNGILKQVMIAYPLLVAQQIQPIVERFISRYQSIFDLWSLRMCDNRIRKELLCEYEVEFESNITLLLTYKDENILSLINFIDGTWPLYECFLRYLRTKYKTTGNSIYSVFRFDVWLAIKNKLNMSNSNIINNNIEIIQKDSCSSFMKVLNNGLQTNFIDENINNSFKNLLQTVPKNHPIIGEWSFTLTNPIIQSSLLRNCFLILEDCIKINKVPRMSSKFLTLSRLWILSMTSHDNLIQQHFIIPKLEDNWHDIAAKFCSLLVKIELYNNNNNNNNILPDIILNYQNTEWYYSGYIMGFILYIIETRLLSLLDHIQTSSSSSLLSSTNYQHIFIVIIQLLEWNHFIQIEYNDKWQQLNQIPFQKSFSHSLLCYLIRILNSAIDMEDSYKLLFATLEYWYIPKSTDYEFIKLHTNQILKSLPSNISHKCSPNLLKKWNELKNKIVN